MREKAVQKRPRSFLFLIKKELRRSWWVLAFSLFTYMLSYQTFLIKNQKLEALHSQFAFLENKKQMALLEKEKLISHLESHTDEEFVSLILKQKLGLVPEGQIKVRFNKDGSGIQSYYDQ